MHLSPLSTDYPQAFRQQVGYSRYEHILSKPNKSQTLLHCYSQKLSNSREHFKTAERLVFIEGGRGRWVTVSFFVCAAVSDSSYVHSRCAPNYCQIVIPQSF